MGSAAGGLCLQEPPHPRVRTEETDRGQRHAASLGQGGRVSTGTSGRVGVARCSQSGDKTNKWNEFARQLYEHSERRFLRTGKQCRERWLNHLDPSKVRYFSVDLVASGQTLRRDRWCSCSRKRD